MLLQSTDKRLIGGEAVGSPEGGVEGLSLNRVGMEEGKVLGGSPKGHGDIEHKGNTHTSQTKSRNIHGSDLLATTTLPSNSPGRRTRSASPHAASRVAHRMGPSTVRAAEGGVATVGQTLASVVEEGALTAGVLRSQVTP